MVFYNCIVGGVIDQRYLPSIIKGILEPIEPIEQMELRSPEQMVGSVMTELLSRRAIIQGIETEAHYQILKCTIPSAELSDFSSQLRSLT